MIGQLIGRDLRERFGYGLLSRTGDLTPGGKETSVVEDANDRLAVPRNTFSKSRRNVRKPRILPERTARAASTSPG